MISGSPKSFDLLGLGGIQPTVGAPQAATPALGGNPAAFGNILDLLLGTPSNAGSPFMMTAPKENGLSGNQVQDLAARIAADVQNGSASLPLLPGMANALTAGDGNGPEPIAMDTHVAASTNAKTTSILPDISASHIKSLLQQASTLPANGTYTVLAAQAKNGQIEFTVRPEADPSKTMTLTLPAATLKDVTSLLSMNGTQNRLGSRENVVGQPMRVSLGESMVTSRTVDSVLSKLNVRELTIDVAPVASAQSTKPEVAVTLIGEFQATPVQLKLQVDSRRLRAKSSGAAAEFDPQGETLLAGKGAKGDAAVIAPVASQPQSDGMLDLSRSLTHEFAAPKKSVTQVTIEASSQSFPTGIDAAAKTSGQSDAMPPVHAVKFTLPDMNSQAMVENGRSVTIKIEPDYLGPAKLHLSVTNDILTARVTVDTPQAKAAIEGSLDKLTDQLNRAGVSVNRIEVSLSNNGAGHQFADQQANWNRPQRMPFQGSAETFSVNNEPAVAVMVPHAPQYMHARGVNLYA